jgi:catecholate siderophore receptor
MLEFQMKHPKGTSVRQTCSPELVAKTPSNLLPLAAVMLAGSMGAAQPALAQSEEKTLKTVTVKDTQDPNLSKESLLVKQTGIAKGNQQLKDIPQTVTVMTEKLMADRNYDDFREVLKSTAGVTFQAGETGEEDVRMRGFSLGQAGDIYVDGLRDAPLTERDTFNTDRVEVLKGSASMLFGKGSTGGVVNQVNEQPFLMDQNETNVTIGSGQMRRITGDFNKQTGESSAFRLNVMTHEADNWGAKADKKGIAGAYRMGIGERDEYSVGLYHLATADGDVGFVLVHQKGLLIDLIDHAAG